MVQPTERGQQPSPRRVSNRVPAHSGTMQHVPGDVLQELQRQGEDQEEETTGRSGPTRGRSTSRTGRSSEANPASLTVSAADSAHPATPLPPPPPSSFSKVAGYARSSRPDIPRGGHRGSSETHAVSELSIALAATVGSTVRSRTPIPSQWSRSAEAVPSQLLGASAGSDANILARYLSSDLYLSTDTAMTPRSSPTPEHARLSPGWLSRFETESPSRLVAPTDSASLKTPHSDHSSPSIGTPSFSSGGSAASSFAYLLRDNRADKRLFQKKSQPLAHRQKDVAPMKRPASVRSASFYKPKVVEDSALAEPPTESTPAVPLPTKLPPTPLSPSSTRTVIRKERVSQSQSLSQSESSRHSSLSLPPAGVKYNRPRPAPLQVKLPSRPVGFAMSPELQSDQTDPLASRRHPKSSPQRLSPLPSARLVLHQQGRRLTPPEADPGTPFSRTPSSGEHYFRTFGPETIYEKTFAEEGDSRQAEKVQEPPLTETAESPLPMREPVGATRMPTKRSHLRDSIFHLFNLASKQETPVREPSDIARGAVSSTHSARDAKTSTPLPTKSSRISIATPEPSGSYFPMHSSIRRNKQSSETSSSTPQTPAIGLSTHWEDVVAQSRPRGHVKPDSAPMSPLSMPQSPARPRPKKADERAEVTQTSPQLPEEVIGQEAAPSLPIAVEPALQAAAHSKYDKNPFVAPPALSWLPSEMKRINTPPVENPASSANKPGPFKSFFFDSRSMPAEQSSGPESDSTEPARLKRRRAILYKKSLSALLPKLSLPKLKRKASMPPIELKEADDPLEVTGFEQTPFSQRYGDTKRNKMSKIRSYLEEAVKESEDDEEMAMMEADIPDHLPSSPLCPLHPRHATGSAMVCPTHRRKRVSAGLTLTKTMQKQVKSPPRIVFESDLRADRGSK